jgi:hypothetical protein
MFELLPSSQTRYAGTTLAANEWGMHDRDGYALAKPAGTFRIALMGASYVMGMGVPRTATFEALVEARLNQERPGSSFERYEILNFALPGYSIVLNTILAEEKALRFRPDAVVIVVSPVEAYLVALSFEQQLKRQGSIGIAALDEILARAGVEPWMSLVEIMKRIGPHMEDVFRWSFGRVAEISRGEGSVPAIVYLPMTSPSPQVLGPNDARVLEIAEEMGLVTMNLEGVFDGWEPAQVDVAPWDQHPNEFGHRLTARRLYEAMLERGEALGMRSQAAPVSAASP